MEGPTARETVGEEIYHFQKIVISRSFGLINHLIPGAQRGTVGDEISHSQKIVIFTVLWINQPFKSHGAKGDSGRENLPFPEGCHFHGPLN